VTWLALAVLAADPAGLDRIRLESDPPKRAVKAIEYASQCLSRARELVSAGDFDGAQAQLALMAEAAELARDATQEKRHISSMKKVEQRARDLLRRLETLRLDLPFDERDAVEPIEQRVQRVQEEVLASIMGRRK
jgi:alkylation response protein AidB-like acyl-CoA dehydrogenase